MTQNTKLQKDSLVFRKRGTALPRLNTEEIRTDNEIHCVRAHSSTVTHPSTIRARLRVTSGSNFVDAITTLPLCQTATNRERGCVPFSCPLLRGLPLLNSVVHPTFRPGETPLVRYVECRSGRAEIQSCPGKRSELLALTQRVVGAH